MRFVCRARSRRRSAPRRRSFPDDALLAEANVDALGVETEIGLAQERLEERGRDDTGVRGLAGPPSMTEAVYAIDPEMTAWKYLPRLYRTSRYIWLTLWPRS